jgi:CDP-6-deoxy-D-xylo-4-hexulose-3-dehydrase
MNRLMQALKENGVEFRRGSAGGGNQLRQPYLQKIIKAEAWKEYPFTEHIHFYGMYIGNFPNLTIGEIDEIVSIINSAVQ